MRIKISLVLLSIILYMSGCSYPMYLPKLANIGENQYGSYIKIAGPKDKIVKGELIAVQPDGIYILTDSIRMDDVTRLKRMRKITLDQMGNFKVYFAKPPSYDIFGPLICLSTLSHGILLVFSLPVNILVTVIVASGADNSVSYDRYEIGLDQLSMYARYPQGIPAGIDVSSIK